MTGAKALWLVLLCLALFTCTAGSEREVVSQADSGMELMVDSRSEIEVRLESNPSTGYGWEVAAMSTPGLVTLQSSSYEEPAESDVVGAAGTQVFVFFVSGEGAGILRLEYLRPFEELPIPERVVEYIIRIDGAPWPPPTVSTPGTSTARSNEG